MTPTRNPWKRKSLPRGRGANGSAKLLVHVLTVPDSLLFLRGQPAFMKTKGYETAVVTSPGDALDAFASATGVVSYGVTMHRRISPVADLKSLQELTQVLRTLEPDIVHAHTAKAGLLGMLAASILGVPKRVYHLRGLRLESVTGNRRRLLWVAERLACRLATDIICVSPSLRERVLEENLVDAHKLKVLGSGSGQGVDTNRYAPPTRELRQTSRNRFGLDNEVVFLFVGRLVRDKGIEELQQAWAEVSRALGEARLLIVGKTEPEDSVPRAVLDRLYTDPSVSVVGFLEDTREAYRAADVVVLPSRREGFPNVPLEAAAMGLPVVTTDATGCVDSIEPELTGLLVPVGNAPLLAAALLRYGRDGGLRSRHGHAGRDRVVRDFQPSAIWEAISAVYGPGDMPRV